MSEWRKATLSEVVRLDIQTTDVFAESLYPIVGVLNRGRGLLVRDSIRGSDTAYRTLNIVRPGQIVYSRLKAFEGAITVVPRTAGEAYASQEFPTFTCGADLIPDFFRLLTTTRQLWDTLQNLSTGMGGRRERVKPAAFLTIPVLLPPLPEQRRIITVMAAIDAEIEAMEEEIRASTIARGPMIAELLSNEESGWPVRPLSEVGEFIRGRRFTKDEYVDSGLGCIHYGQVHTHFGALASSAITFLPEESRSRLRLAKPGDVVVAATSEDTAALGKATVWLGSDDVAVHDDCYIYRHKLDPRFASYLFASPQFQREKVQYASGTKVTRISGENLGKVQATIPPVEVQVMIGEALSAFDEHIDRLRAELAALRTVRGDLLTALLSQEKAVDIAVDKFVKAA